MAILTFSTGATYSLYRVSDNTHFGGGTITTNDWEISEEGTAPQQNSEFDTSEFVQLETSPGSPGPGTTHGGTYMGMVNIGGTDYPVFSLGGTYMWVFGINTGGTPASIDPGTFDTSNFAFCFGEGTLIGTGAGATAVEALAIGDLVQTAEGGLVPVKWIGRQTVHKLLSGRHMQPVRIREGALGDGLPTSDLTVTADHGMIVDGLVINASALVNGETIDFVPMADVPDQVTYYHIETEAHDVILANGAEAETFMDAAGRKGFDNHQEYLDLYGVERIIPEMSRPRINAQRLLPDAIKARLGIEAAANGFGLVQIA